ncbi:MAG TPA: PAS domain S-box protein, partial [Verrucomicrobiae bacterium]
MPNADEFSEYPAKELLAAIVDSSDDAILSKNLDGIITSWNLGAERLLGFTRAEAIGSPISIMIPPDKGAQEAQILERLKKGERIDHFETTRLCKSGRAIDVSLTISPIKNSNGKVVGASSVIRDITGLKLAARQLAEEKQRLQVTLASIGDGVIVTDEHGRVTFLNPVAQELTGWKAQEAQSQPLDSIFSIVNEKSRRKVENPATRALQDNVTVGLANHTVLVGKHGRECAIDDCAAPIRDGAGIPTGVVLVFREVTEHRNAQAAKARLAAIVESSDDAIVSKDLDGRIISWNKGAERIFGYTAEEAVGRHISMIIPPDHLQEEPEILQRLRRAERVDHFETVRMSKSGSRVEVSLTISPILDAEGTVVGASKIARNISDRKKAERELSALTYRVTSILESINEGFMSFNQAWQFTYVNPRAATMLRLKAEEVIGKTLWETLPQLAETEFKAEHEKSM